LNAVLTEIQNSCKSVSLSQTKGFGLEIFKSRIQKGLYIEAVIDVNMGVDKDHWSKAQSAESRAQRAWRRAWGKEQRRYAALGLRFEAKGVGLTAS